MRSAGLSPVDKHAGSDRQIVRCVYNTVDFGSASGGVASNVDS